MMKKQSFQEINKQTNKQEYNINILLMHSILKYNSYYYNKCTSVQNPLLQQTLKHIKTTIRYDTEQGEAWIPMIQNRVRLGSL